MGLRGKTEYKVKILTMGSSQYQAKTQGGRKVCVHSFILVLSVFFAPGTVLPSGFPETNKMTHSLSQGFSTATLWAE